MHTFIITVHPVNFIGGVGNTRIISPVGEDWDQWFDGPGISNDFMNDREQPPDQEREVL